MLRILLAVSLLALTTQCEQLLHIHPTNGKDVEDLKKLGVEGIDMWQSLPDTFEAYVPSEKAAALKERLEKMQCSYQVTSQDLTKDIQYEKDFFRNSLPTFNYNLFNNLDSIYKELDRLASKCLPGFVCSLDSIGLSVESRPIKRLKVTKTGAKRKAMWLDATVHAREWLTTATFMKILQHFFEKYSSDKEVTHLLDTYDWHLVPVVNPDGYEFSWGNDTQQRRWRKNRRMNGVGKCAGVDLNRNADHAWGDIGSDSDVCGETYRGASVASEPETQAWQAAVKKEEKNIVQVVDIHARGQYWMTSYGSFDERTKKCYDDADAGELLRVAHRAADAIGAVYNTTWKRGPICSTMYISSGSLIDYAKQKTKIKYTGLPEVRGSSFVVDPDQIEPSFKEIYAGLVESIKAIEEHTG